MAVLGLERAVMNAKKRWLKPSVTTRDLTAVELASLFPELGEEERRRVLERAQARSSHSGGS